MSIVARVFAKRTRLLSIFPVIVLVFLTVPAPSQAAGIAGSIYADSTWSGSVLVGGDVVVQPGATLRILAGTTVRFTASASSYDDELGTAGRCDLIVLGGMAAVGGPGASEGIVFDSDAPSPAPGQWGRIWIYPIAVDSLCTYRYLDVRHGTVGMQIGLSDGGGQVTIRDCRFFANSVAGIDWRYPASPVSMTGMTFDGNGQQGLSISNAASVALDGCQFSNNGGSGLVLSNVASTSGASVGFQTNGTALAATSCGSINLATCTFSSNGTGMNASVSGMVTVTGCTITGSGSGSGLSVGSNSKQGGLRLEGSTVGGAVVVSGRGVAQILGNPSLGSVMLTANVSGDTLRSVVRLNQVQGAIYLRSQDAPAYHEAEVYGNRASQLKFLAYTYRAWAYMSAVADSNVITPSGTDAVWISSGLAETNGPWYGYTDLTLSRNVLTGGTSGVTATLETLYDWVVGYVNLIGEDNVITGAGVGERFNCQSNIRASLTRERITNCGTGLTSVGGKLFMRSCRIADNATGGLALSGMDSTRIGGSLEEANDILDNTGYNLAVTGSPVRASHNYWGAVSEDSLVARLSGSAKYSPWTDAGHEGLYTSSYQKGVLAGNVHWSGEVKVTGDVLIPSGSTLTVDPGTQVKLWANASQWDTLGVTAGRCDLIVDGTLRVLGGSAPSDSAWFSGWLPLQEVTPAGGQWGRMAFLAGSVDDSCWIDHARLKGATVGIAVTDAGPLVSNSVIGVTSGHGVESTGNGLIRIVDCAITGSGSGSGLSVGSNSKQGGLRLEGSTVAGAVVVSGRGVAQILSNPSLGSVMLTANVSGDTLRSVVRLNQVQGAIYLRSQDAPAYHEAEVYGNRASQLKFLAYTYRAWAYMSAVADSNVITPSGTDAIWISSGLAETNGPWYGYTDLTLSRNVLTGGTSGVTATLETLYDWVVGYVNLIGEDNVITGAGVGERFNCQSNIRASLTRESITNCGTGLTSVGGKLFMRSCRIADNATGGLALSGMDSTRIGGSLEEANDILDNTGYNLAVTGSPVRASHNYWGAVSEDSLVARLSGSAKYSPWADAGHEGLYTSSYQKGVLAGNVHWSGEVKVTGDVLIPSGSTLTVDPGTQVKLWANASQWDTLGVTAGRCDLIVDGTLRVLGGSAPSDSAWFSGWLPLQEVTPAGGQWGRMAFLAGSVDDSCWIDHARLKGATVGIAVTDAGPLVSNSVIGVTSGHGVESTGNGLIRIVDCAITGSGSGSGLSVGSNSKQGGLRLEGSTVGGAVVVSGRGVAQILGNPSLGSVMLTANVSGDTLRSVVRLNQVQGAIYLRSQDAPAYHEAEVYGNRASQLKFLAYTYRAWAYMSAVADSNVITPSGTDAIWISSGLAETNGPWYGYTDLTLSRNVLTGGTSGVTATLETLYDWVVGYVNLIGEDNVITGAGVGERFNCQSNIRASLTRERITNCGTGLTSVGGKLFMRSCRIADNATGGLALSGMDSTRIGGSLEEANDILDNTGYNLAVTGSPVRASHNYWGAVSEDSLVARLSGSAKYSPWADAGHEGLYTSSYQKGVLAGNVHWSGEVKVTGDVLIPSGSTLTVDPGTQVKLWANASQWDTLGVTAGRCDLIVDGTLRVLGGSAPSDSAWFSGWLPLQEVTPAGGQWGRMAFLAGSVDDSCWIDHARLKGATVGIAVTDAGPLVSNSVIGVTSGHGVESTGNGLIRIVDCAITGSGSGSGLSVGSNSKQGGLRLEGSTVAGAVVVSGRGVAQILSNPSLGSVMLTANVSGDTLRSVVRLNQVQGAIYLRSQDAPAYHEAEVYGNRASQLKFLAYTYRAWAYMSAVADSNVITPSGTDAVWISSGLAETNGPWYGYTDLTLSRNVLTGGTSGVTATLETLYDWVVGYVNLIGEDNVITGAGVGERFNCQSNIRASLTRESITNCGTGLTSAGGKLFFSNCVFTGSPQTAWAVAISGADSVSCEHALVDNWTNGISLNACGWSEIVDSDLRGIQQGFGVKCVGSSPTIRNNHIDHYLTAIQAESNANPLVGNNSLSCAADWGLNNLSPGVMIDARDNWWGGASGPHNYESNPAGTGSPVSDYVLFAPWLDGYANRPPLPFDLMLPTNGAVLDSIPVLDWTDARDPDCHDVVTYTLYMSPDTTFATPRVIAGIAESRFVVPDSLFAATPALCYWKVRATDHTAEDLVWCRQQYWSFTIPAVTGVETPGPLPTVCALHSCRPNPFNPSTTIGFDLPAAQRVKVTIFDAMGRCVRTLVDEGRPAGRYEVRWDGTTDGCRTLASGVYFCRMEAGPFRESRRMTLVR